MAKQNKSIRNDPDWYEISCGDILIALQSNSGRFAVCTVDLPLVAEDEFSLVPCGRYGEAFRPEAVLRWKKVNALERRDLQRFKALSDRLELLYALQEMFSGETTVFIDNDNLFREIETLDPLYSELSDFINDKLSETENEVREQ